MRTAMGGLTWRTSRRVRGPAPPPPPGRPPPERAPRHDAERDPQRQVTLEEAQTLFGRSRSLVHHAPSLTEGSFTRSRNTRLPIAITAPAPTIAALTPSAAIAAPARPGPTKMPDR